MTSVIFFIFFSFFLLTGLHTRLVWIYVSPLILSWARGLVWDEGWGLGMSNDWDDNEWMGG